MPIPIRTGCTTMKECEDVLADESPGIKHVECLTHVVVRRPTATAHKSEVNAPCAVHLLEQPPIFPRLSLSGVNNGLPRVEKRKISASETTNHPTHGLTMPFRSIWRWNTTCRSPRRQASALHLRQHRRKQTRRIAAVRTHPLFQAEYGQVMMLAWYIHR
jgi:hypothetical protein